MKKVSLLFTLLIVAIFSHAQYDAIKNKLLYGTTKFLEEAKADFDKKQSNAKFMSRPEAYLLKASVYSYLGSDSSYRADGKSAPLMQEAAAAFEKYIEMDPKGELLKDPIYRYAPINVYSDLFDQGYEFYKANKWAESFAKYKEVARYSDILGQHQLLTAPLDTNTLILAAYTAEMANLKEDAAHYYGKLADAKVSGPNYESVYRFLVTHNFQKKDMAGFEKYKTLGGQLYPESEFFTYDEVDFAVGLETDFDKKIAALDEQLKANPNNYKANLSMVELGFDALHSEREDAPKPADPKAIEQKMLVSLDKVIELKPEEELAYLIKGDHYINLSIAADKKREEHAKDMKARTKPGTAASKEDVAKRDQLDNEYMETIDKAREPYEKACEILGRKSELNGNDRQQYKKAAGYLGDIYQMKASRTKVKADATKFEALAKKWNDVYGSIK